MGRGERPERLVLRDEVVAGFTYQSGLGNGPPSSRSAGSWAQLAMTELPSPPLPLGPSLSSLALFLPFFPSHHVPTDSEP